MNLKYLAGKLISESIDQVLSNSRFPLFNLFSSGLRWEYDVCRYANTRKLDVLFDVGANIGQTVSRLHRYFPDASIYSFEPIQSTFEKLETECRRYPHVHPFCMALGAAEESREIMLQGYSEFNSLRFEKNADSDASAPKETVQVQTVDNFCDRHQIERIDLLKTDAQGCDLEVLLGAKRLMAAHKVSFILTEVTFQHDDTINQHFAPIHEYLTGQGYRLAGIYDQCSWGPRMMILGFANALYVHPEAFHSLSLRKPK